MKRLWFSAVFLSLIIALCTFEQITVNKVYDKLTDRINTAISTQVQQEKRQYCLQIEEEWDKYYYILALMSDHDMIEDANAYIGMLDTISTLSVEETNEILVETQSEIERLKETSEISMRNIL